MRVCIHVCVFAYVVLQCAGARAAAQNTLLAYPYAWRDENVVDDYHGTKIKDPYRWLENPFSSESKQFVKDQNLIMDSYVQPCRRNRDYFPRMKPVLGGDNEIVNIPIRAGHRYFLEINTKWYVQDSLDGERRLLLDPTTLSTDGTSWVSEMEFSPDGSTLAYGVSSRSSYSGNKDLFIIHFKDVATGQNHRETLRVAKTNIAWSRDSKGLFYSDVLQEYRKNYVGTDAITTLNYHLLNTSQAADIVILRYPDLESLKFITKVTDNGQHLLVYIRRTNFFSLHPVAIRNLSAIVTSVSHNFNTAWYHSSLPTCLQYVTDAGYKSIFKSNLNNNSYDELVTIDLDKPAKENWRTLVPGDPSMTLLFASAVDNDKLVLHYSRQVKNVIRVHDLQTGSFLHEIQLEVGQLTQVSSKKDQSDLFIKLWTFFAPSIIYYFDFKSPQPYKPKVYAKRIVEYIDPSLYETKQIFYSSKDCTRVPMYIISKRGLPRNGSNPTLLFGYGGFNYITEPFFEDLWLMFVRELRGVFAMANIRGGGEYGEYWHEAGIRHKKQKSLDDFQAAAIYLIRSKYTRPELLTIQGASNGGLLVAACINQRPELFGAAIVLSGLTDMLQHTKQSHIREYGSSNLKEDFNYLVKYSPLHNIRPPGQGRAQYPATLVATGATDKIVKPLHSLKFIAALQHAVRGSNQTRPLLARIYKNVDHTYILRESSSDVVCFIIEALKLKPDFQDHIYI